jgi:hypothetical protein
MSDKDSLIQLVREADSLIKDTSIFAILGTNNPKDHIYDKITSKGYFLTALGCFVTLGYYSRIFSEINAEQNIVLSLEQEKAIKEINKLIKENRLSKYYIRKRENIVSRNDEDSFVIFMNALILKKNVDFNIDKKFFRVIWRFTRNMIAHMGYPLVTIGGKYILSTDKDAVEQLKLPIYDPIEVMNILRRESLPNEIFLNKNGKITVQATVLLAYMFPIRDFLIEEINNSDEKQCSKALSTIKHLINKEIDY